jgi:Tol biopolymer transport system component
MITAMQFPRQGGSLIIRMRTNGSNRRVLARAGPSQANYGPTYAPNGRRILFNRVTYGKHSGGPVQSDLLVTTGTGQPRNLTANDAAQYSSPSWSPEGQSILAVRGTTGNAIVRMNAEARDVRVLTTVHGPWLSSPVYSPDGTKIAYMQCDGDCGDPQLSGEGSLWVMNADGSNQTPILEQDANQQPFFQVSWAVPAP